MTLTSLVTDLLALGALASVAACSSDHGVSLAVTVPAGVDHVELLIAPSRCQAGNQVPRCDDGMAWDTAQAKQKGDIYILDNDLRLEAEVGGDGVARFRIEADADHTSIDRIAVVGYAGTRAAAVGTLEGVTIPLHHAEVWSVALETLPDIVHGDPGDVDRMHVWKRMDPAMASCLAIERIENMQPKFEFFVPPGDTDCDDETPECDDYWWRYKPIAGMANCLTAIGPLNAGACTLGSTMCADGKTAPMACAQLPMPEVCVPDVFCEACTAGIAGCAGPTLVANLASAMPGQGMPSLDCTFPYDVMTGSKCATTGDTGYLDLSLAVGANETCESALFIADNTPGLGGSDTLPLGAVQLKLSPASGGARCTFMMQWTDGVHDVTTPAMTPGFIDLLMHTSRKHVLLPFQIEFSTDSCVATTVDICKPNGSLQDHVFSCLNP